MDFRGIYWKAKSESKLRQRSLIWREELERSVTHQVAEGKSFYPP